MKNILVPIDFSPLTQDVVRAAEVLSRRSPARLVLLSVVRLPLVLNKSASAMKNVIRNGEEKMGKRLAACATKLSAAGFEVEALERFGPPVECIVEEASRIDAEYIVMGSHGHSAIYELFVGSTTAGVLKKAPCPVLIVRPADQPTEGEAESATA